jgi:hypothetical protein
MLTCKESVGAPTFLNHGFISVIRAIRGELYFGANEATRLRQGYGVVADRHVTLGQEN